MAGSTPSAIAVPVAAGCETCGGHCPQESIELVREPSKGEPLEIQKLIAEATVTG